MFNLTKPATVETAPDIHFLELSEIPEKFLPHNMYAVYETSRGAELRREFREWLDATGTYYYSRPGESFYLHEAVELATAAGCGALLLEDLS